MSDSTSIALSSDHLLVLYDLVVRLNSDDGLRIDDQAEHRVLWDLESELERGLPDVLAGGYHERVRAARDRLRDVID